MGKLLSWLGRQPVALLGTAGIVAISLLGSSYAEQQERPAFVIVERIATTGDESIQDQYGRLARDILPKYGARYLARSRNNLLLEGDAPAPCCIALLQFPSMAAAKRWYDSPENQSAAALRQSGAKFRLLAIEGLLPQS
jgi:uncharacterized protein (DUF1330 family)